MLNIMGVHHMIAFHHMIGFNHAMDIHQFIFRILPSKAEHLMCVRPCFSVGWSRFTKSSQIHWELFSVCHFVY